MADFYIRKQTKSQYPNTIRQYNRAHPRQSPVNVIYSLTYISKGQYDNIQPLGSFRTMKAAKDHANEYARKRLNSHTVTFLK